MNQKRFQCFSKPLAFVTGLMLAVCGTAAAATTQPLKVCASLPMIGEWVAAVGQDAVSVRVLSPLGADPHSFEPSARSITMARNSQALFAMGLGLEPWIERIEKADPSLRIIRIAPTADLRLPAGACAHHDHDAHHSARDDAHPSTTSDAHHPGRDDAHPSTTSDAHHANRDDAHTTRDDAHTTRDDADHPGKDSAHHDHEGNAPANAAHAHAHDGAHAESRPVAHEHHHHHEHEHGEFDPHVWLDPVLVKQMVATIAAELAALAPEHREQFEHNALAYSRELDALDAQIRAELAGIPAAQRKLVTNHDNLRYFAARYDFEVSDTLLGTQGSEGGQPSARKVRELVEQIRSENIRAVFADAFSERSLLNAVASEAGIAPPWLFYSIPAGANSPAPDYLQMMRHNAEQIRQALSQ